ncbi:hypothetical protein Fmac_028841 [Flemingia macrophylla]|uniref:Uncharacterized protein n=1 Tax=Flemingia macrophylla TaxID=520843 RepID=A0ABD1L8M2_9FABA
MVVLILYSQYPRSELEYNRIGHFVLGYDLYSFEYSRIEANLNNIAVVKCFEANTGEDLQTRHAKALEEVKRELASKTRENAHHGLSIVDSIHRLGIEHHFEEEIDTILSRKHQMLKGQNKHRNDYQDLAEVALQFRLLRQEGYYIHEDVFDKFWDKKGNLKQTFCDDVYGLIGLFEASQLSIEGEDYLHGAEGSIRQYLNSWLSRFHDHHHVNVVADSLRWWKDLGVQNDLKFSRDEPIKWYMWPMACLPDPRFSELRLELTKPLSLVYIIDDMFDSGASVDDLTLFTKAVKRWDVTATEQLPDYMKGPFKALYDVTNEFAFKAHIKHGLNPISTLIKSWVRLLNAFLVEAKWFALGHVPKAEEYLENAVVSTGAHMILVHAFFFMGEGITEETVTLMDGFPNIIFTTSKIVRLCDDLEGDQDVNRDGNDGSYLKCYMKEHPGVSVEQTREHVNDLISDAWKRLNKECLREANPLPPSFTKLCLNAARMVPLMYSYDSNSPSKLEEYVKSLL